MATPGEEQALPPPAPDAGFDTSKLDALPPAEVALIAAIRKEVADLAVEPGDEYWKSDHALHRFLVARSLKLKDAVEMYRHTLEHRRVYKCAGLLGTAPSGAPNYSVPAVMRLCFPWGVAGLDRQGFPVLVERIGAVDLVGMEKAVGPEQFLQWVCWYHEVQERLMRRVCDALGKNRHKMTCIIDMGGVSLRHLSSATLSIIKRRARLEEDNYPEVVKRVFLINTPAVFSTVWSVVKLFVDPGTLDKMRLYSSGYLPVLSEFIDPECIPAYLGGKLVDAHGDPECKALIGPGGMVPLSYLVNVGTDGRGLGEEVTIPAGKHSDVVVRAPAGATVAWRWGAQAHDAAFSVGWAPAGVEGSPDGVVDVPASTCGVHMLAKGYGGPVPHGLRAPHVAPVVFSPGALGDPIPGSAPGCGAPTEAQGAVKVSSHTGALALPAALPGGATHAVVRLRWDNSYAWMASKTLARRVDVTLAGERPEAAATELERDDAEARAREREANMAAFPGEALVARHKAAAEAAAAAGAKQ